MESVEHQKSLNMLWWYLNSCNNTVWTVCNVLYFCWEGACGCRYYIYNCWWNGNLYILIKKFHKCSKTLTSLDSCRSCTALAASRSKYGRRRVLFCLSSPKRAHQAYHRPGYPIFSPGDNGNQCDDCPYHLSAEPQRNLGNKAALPSYDY